MIWWGDRPGIGGKVEGRPFSPMPQICPRTGGLMPGGVSVCPGNGPRVAVKPISPVRSCSGLPVSILPDYAFYATPISFTDTLLFSFSWRGISWRRPGTPPGRPEGEVTMAWLGEGYVLIGGYWEKTWKMSRNLGLFQNGGGCRLVLRYRGFSPFYPLKYS